MLRYWFIPSASTKMLPGGSWIVYVVVLVKTVPLILEDASIIIVTGSVKDVDEKL